MRNLGKILIAFTACMAIGALSSCNNGSNPTPTPTPTPCVHVDKDKNHICDLCGVTISNHSDADNNHECDLCGTVV